MSSALAEVHGNAPIYSRAAAVAVAVATPEVEPFGVPEGAKHGMWREATEECLNHG
jgi:hypothetical protein